MVSIRYFFEVCGAWCRKWIPTLSVTSTKSPGTSSLAEAANETAGHHRGTDAQANNEIREATAKANPKRLRAGIPLDGFN
jgi:hypothetical protein